MKFKTAHEYENINYENKYFNFQVKKVKKTQTKIDFSPLLF